MLSQIHLWLPNLLTHPLNQTPHRNLLNLNLHAWLLAIKEQGFSEAVAALIEHLKEVQPVQSMRQSGPFLQSGATIIRWTSGKQPINSIADFLLYLFQDRRLHPSTTDGYRSAIADKLGNLPINVSKNEDLTGLLDSSSVRGISPSGIFLVSFTSLQRLLLNPLKRPHWSIWPSRLSSS